MLPIGAAIASMGVAAGLAVWVGRQHSGTEQMMKISTAVRQGAQAFLRREFRIVIPAAVALAVIIALASGFSNGVAFAVGAALSALAGLIALKITVKAAVRTPVTLPNIRPSHSPTRIPPRVIVIVPNAAPIKPPKNHNKVSMNRRAGPGSGPGAPGSSKTLVHCRSSSFNSRKGTCRSGTS